MARKPKPDPAAGADSKAIADLLQTLMDALGRGGLTWAANQINMTPTALLKRMKRPEKAFDEPTMRLVLLLTASRSDNDPDQQPYDRTHQTEDYIVGLRDQPDGTATPFWTPQEETTEI